MAKSRDQATDMQSQLAANGATGEANSESASATDQSTLLTEIERLRRENEILKRRQIAATGLSEERGQRKVYRVSLPGMRTMMSERVVSPRLSAPIHFRLLPPKSYRDLDLFLDDAGNDPNKIVQAAWERFCKESPEIQETLADKTTRALRLHPVEHKQLFSITAQVGPGVDYLDIPAVSPADAFELFRIFNGITATSVRPNVALAPQEIQSQNADKAQNAAV